MTDETTHGTTDRTWQDWALTALAGLPDRITATLEHVTQEVAIRFAGRFAAADRDHPGVSPRPARHALVDEAVTAALAAAGWSSRALRSG